MASVTVAQIIFTQATVMIAVSGGPGNIRDYVAIYSATAPFAAPYLVWSYLNNGRDAAHRPPKGLAGGTVTFTNLKPGKYQAKLFSLTDAGVATLLTTTPFEVAASPVAGGGGSKIFVVDSSLAHVTDIQNAEVTL